MVNLIQNLEKKILSFMLVPIFFLDNILNIIKFFFGIILSLYLV